MIIFRKINTFLHAPWTLGLKMMKWTWWLWSDETYLKLYYYFKTQKKLHLRDPKTFNEKLQWLKLYDRKDIYTSMVDKYDVKELVRNKIGADNTIKTIALFESVADINWDILPQRFVIKTTNGGGSGGVVICKDKRKLDIKKAEKKLLHSYNRNIYNDLREWPYKNIKSRIIVEELLEDIIHGELYDYKVMCFNGKASFIQLHKGRGYNHTQDFYNTSWKKQNTFVQPPCLPSNDIDSKPTVLDEMLQKSEILAKDIPFVRVDWYIVNSHLFFGEMTFFDASGFDEFEPEEWNLRFGEMLALPH